MTHFTSLEISRLAGVTLRQLQWWDERDLICPRKEGHRRLYLPREAVEVLTVTALQRKGVSLQRIRQVLLVLRREFDARGEALWKQRSRLYLLTDGESVHLEESPARVVAVLEAAQQPMCLVSLSDQIGRVAALMTGAAQKKSRNPNCAWNGVPTCVLTGS